MEELNDEQNIEIGENKTNKKQQTTKKPRVSKLVKKKEILEVLHSHGSLPPYLVEILSREECKRVGLPKLTKEETEKLWRKLEVFIRENVSEINMAEDDGGLGVEGDEVREEKRVDLVGALAGLMLHTATLNSPEENDEFLDIAKSFNVIAVHPRVADNKTVQNQICELSELCCIKGLKVPPDFYLNTFSILLDHVLNSNGDVDMHAEPKRLWEMRLPLARMNLHAPKCDFIVDKLTRLLASKEILNSKDGLQFVAFTFTLNEKLTKKFHEVVKNLLPCCSKAQASHYGQVYHTAWINGSQDTRKIMETCIQNLMGHILTVKRKGREMSPLGQNLFAFLSYLHANRQNPQFSRKLTELYTPLIWRHLRSGCNIERCNAAEVLFSIYPLEVPGSGRVADSDLLHKQHTEMGDLLTDNCPVLRMISIRGVCYCMSVQWDTFTQEGIQVLMRKMLSLANDSSSSLVRRSLYKGLSVMLSNPRCASYLARVLPDLRQYVHDVNVKVRAAFVKMLLVLKGLPSPKPIKYLKVVPLHHLAARLEVDGVEVGSLIASLVMSGVYSENLSTAEFLFRMIKFIEENSNAARKLFQYSKKALSYKDALRIMLTTLVNIRSYVKKCIQESNNDDEDQENKPQEECPPINKRKKRKSFDPLQPIDENKENSSVQEHKPSGERGNESSTSSSTYNSSASSAEEDAYANPATVHTLIDIVSLLWTLHSKTIADNEQDHTNLTDVACAGIPMLLKHYRGTPTYFAVVHLSTLVPSSKLAGTSTVVSACISQLRGSSEVSPEAELRLVVTALCSWNRFADIQDVVTDWLDQAFRCEGLNQSQTAEERAKQRKVRFVAKGGKPMLALMVLDALFDHQLSHKRVMEKSYANVLEFFNYLERIKTLVERRLLAGLPFDSPMLSDQFLLQCMYRYTRLMIILHRSDGSFDASEVFEQFLQWTMNVVKPLIEVDETDEAESFSVLLVRDVLRTAANLVDVGYASVKCIISMAELMQGLFATDCSLWFVEPSTWVMRHVKDFAAAEHGPRDDFELLKVVVPAILTRGISALGREKYTHDQVTDCIKNMNEVKTAMHDVVKYLYKIGPHSSLLEKVLRIFTDAIVNVLCVDIKKLHVLDPVDKVQELPFACGFVLSIVLKPPLRDLWLLTIPSTIKESYAPDADILAGATALLHTLVRADLRLPQDKLTDCVVTAHAAIKAYERGSTASVALNRSESDASLNTSIDVKRLATPILKDLASILQCSLN